jgi:hypothetical protein
MSDPTDRGDRAEVRDEPERPEDTPGSPESDAPMTETTDGGLEGGDPGVEE